MTAGSVTLNPGAAGEDVATDETGGVVYQKIKIVDGTTDGTEGVTASAANGLEVDVTRSALPTGAATAAAQLPDGHNVTVDNASIAVTNADITTVAGAVAAGQMQVDIVADGADLLTNTSHDAAFGTAGTADAQVRSVQGIAGGTDLPVSNAGLTELAAAINTSQLDVNIATDSVGIGGGTQYAENVGLGAAPTGTLALARQDAALTATGSIDDDAQPLHVDANGALWVTPSGDVTIADGGNTITVDGTVNLGTAVVDLGANNDVTIESGAVLGTTGTAGPANALSVGGTEAGGTFRELAVDASGNLQVDIVSGGTGSTQYAEDTAHITGDTGTMALGVRQSTQADFGADGDYSPLSIDDEGGLRVSVVGGVGGTHTDDAAFTPATDDGVPIFGMFDDTTPDSVDEGDAGVVRMSANRNLYGTIRDAAGNERGVNVNAANQLEVNIGAQTADVTIADGGNVITVDGTVNLGTAAVTNAGTFVVQEDGAALTALQTLDNTVVAQATALGTTSVNLAGANATAAAPTHTEGTINELSTDLAGALRVTGSAGVTEETLGTGTYLEGTSVGNIAAVVRSDAGGSLVNTDNEITALQVDSSGNLRVTGGGGGVEYTEGATDATITGSVAMMEVAADTLQPIQGTVADGLLVNLGAQNNVTVDSGTVTANAGTNLNTSALLTTTAHDAAFGTAGTADAQVRSVQGIAGGTALEVDLGANNNVTVDSGTVTTVSTVTNLAQMGAAAISMNTGVRDAGTQRVTIATNDAVPVTSTALTDIETNTDFGATTGNGTAAGALRVSVASDSTGTLAVDLGANNDVDLNAGANLIGDVGLSGARTSGGTTIFRSIDLDETEEQVKATGGQIYWIHAINTNAALRYLKVYNATAATVVVGTTTPVLTFPIPAATTGAGFTLSIPNGIAFATAITVAATTGVADADTGAPGANEVIVNLGYA